MAGTPIDTRVAQPTNLDETRGRVNIPAVLERIRTPQWVAEYRQLEALRWRYRPKPISS